MSIATILMVQALLLNSQQATENSVEKLRTVIPTPQPTLIDFYNTAKTDEELQKDIEYHEFQEALQRQIEEDLARIAEEQEKLKQAQLEQERINNITRVYYVSSDISKPSNLNGAEMNKGLAGTKMEGLGQYFVDAEKEYGINALFLASIGALESGWGKSDYAQNRNNLFGYGAYDSNPDNAYYFSSKRTGIMTVGERLATNYVSPQGKFYSGSTPTGVMQKYTSDPEWASKVVTIMNKIVKNAF